MNRAWRNTSRSAYILYSISCLFWTNSVMSFSQSIFVFCSNEKYLITVAECEWGRGGGGCGQETAEGGRLEEGGAQSYGRRKIQVGGP